MKFHSIYFVLCLCLSFFFGCAEDPEGTNSKERFDGDFCEISCRQKEPYAIVETNGIITSLKADDVIVAVNGYPLTKGIFDELMVMKAKQLSKMKDTNPTLVANQLEDFKRLYISLFVSQRLLLDNAREMGVVTSNEVNKAVNDYITRLANHSKKSIKEIVASYPGNFRYYLYDVAQEFIINKLINKHIPPKLVTNDEFVKCVQDQVAKDNADAEKTNNLIRVQMSEWKASIISHKITFEEVASKYSQDTESKGNDIGFWGDFERGGIDNKNIQAVAFSLKIGEISDPVEDDDGFHLIKVLAITPPKRNSNGRIIQNEVRTLAHIYREKVPLIIVQTDEALFSDLKRQMQLQAIDDYVEQLRTNGTNRVEFPHGTDLFR